MNTKSDIDCSNEVRSAKSMFLVIILCLLGVLVSLELTRIHLFVHTDPTYHSVCAVSDGINCETVATSPFSVFAGVPVSVWGLLAYLAIGFLGLWALSKRRLHSTWPYGFLIILAMVAVVISAILGYISAVHIDSLCLFCMASYTINVILLITCVVVWRRSHCTLGHLLGADLRALGAHPKTSMVMALASIGILFSLQMLPAYWKTPGWTNLPLLPSGITSDGQHWIGAENPALTIVEFSDYECPHCRAAHKQIRLLAAQHPTTVRLIHRHLPLDASCHPGMQRPFHQRACEFAEVAECAALQNKFWAMNDALFSIQETAKTADVDPLDLAVRLGLNRSDFRDCWKAHATSAKVGDDIQAAMKRKMNGTPTFMVGDRLFLGRIPEAEFQALLKEVETAAADPHHTPTTVEPPGATTP